MQWLRNLSLTGKVVSLVALLAALAVVITVYSLTHLYRIDRDYRTLLEHEAQAAVWVTAATGDLNDAARQVLAVLTEQEEAAMRATQTVLAQQQQDFLRKLHSARPLLPAASEQFEHIESQAAQLFSLAERIVDAAARWRGDSALEIIHQQFDPLLITLRSSMEAVRSDSVVRFQSATQELNASTESTLRNSAVAFAVALLGIIGLSIWMPLTHIARPIQELTASMQRLSQRDYQQRIAHTERGDELGQMAQALEVFRHALQHSDYLEVAKAEAERLALAKSSFLATMSHEIRTPLNAIIGLAQLSLRRAQTPELQTRLSHIQQAGEHLLGVVNNILDFSKIEAGFLQAESVAFAPQQLLEDVRVLLAGSAAAKSLILLTEAQLDLPVLIGDPLRIRQILFNFTSNAIKFSERGTVQLRLHLEREQQPWMLYGQVSDQGIGLSAQQIAELFQPFQQTDSSISRRFGGTGLGLAISRSLAQLLGGAVGVDSQPGVGSQFWFRVAVQEAGADAVPLAVGTPAAASPAALQGLRVLLVDDNELNRLVGRELLLDAGIFCDLAVDGRQALDLLLQAPANHYDAVLMDMMMPGMDGCSATRQLRCHPQWDALPVIAMTANTSEEDVQACLAAGMSALVPKPIDEHILWTTLLAHCRQSAAAPAAVRLVEPALEPTAGLTAEPAAPGFDLAAALERLGQQRGLYDRLAGVFLAGQGSLREQLQQALLQQDEKGLRLHLHTLQGQAATFGAIALQQAAAQAERAVKRQASATELVQLLDTLQTQWDAALAYLQQLQTQPPAAAVEAAELLPASQAAQTAPAASMAAPESGSAPLVLVVDDQAASAQVLVQLLQTDCQVVALSSGQQALDFCQQQALPDLILLDIVMPEMDGLEVCRRLKADRLTAHIPVLFVTAQSSPEEESAALAAGGVDFISKPVNHAVVRARVRTQWQLKTQRDQLRQQVMVDGLTGIANRRRFDEVLALEWRHAQRQRKPLALLMIDIDHFKRYNDAYGHLAGDECLKTVAQTLQQLPGRAHDLTARYGGEEFVRLLPDMTADDALFKAEALCRSVAALQLPHKASLVAEHVTISVGVAVWRFDQAGDAGAPEQLLAAADAALYAAKNAGRNRAVLAT